MDPNFEATTTAPKSEAIREFPSVLAFLGGLWLAFELLVVLGIVAQPVPVVNGRIDSGLAAALLGSITYLGLLFLRRAERRLFWSDAVVPVSMILLAQCADGLTQLSAVVLPRTSIHSIWDDALGSARKLPPTPDTIHLMMLLTVALVAAASLALDDSERGHRSWTAMGRALVVSSLAAAVCLAVPVGSAPAFGAGIGNLQPSQLAAATTPGRLGAVSFPVIWSVVLGASWVRRSSNARQARLRRWLAAAGLAVIVAFAMAVEPRPLLSIPLAIALGTLALIGRRDRVASGKRDDTDSPAAATFSPSDMALIAVFFMSGAAALVYQVVFAKGLALTFGSTSHASTIVLATYMAGLALGSWVGGRYAERVARPILTYAAAELGIALICVLAPLTLRATRALYVSLAAGSDPAEPWLVGLQLGLGALVLIPPTFFMGVTMPMLTRHLLRRRDSLGVSAGVLYTSNTLGAAAGALVTGYNLMPTFGVTASLRIAVGLNMIVAALAIALSRSHARAQTAPAANSEPNVHEPEQPHPATDLDLALGWIALAQLTVGGFVTFGLETTFVHLLATIAGNSTYAFSLMLFAFLVGLGTGSNGARRWLRSSRDFGSALLMCQALLALALLLGIPFWDGIPGYFAIFGGWLPAKSFAARELIRFLACLVVMLPPAFFIGAQFPIAMDVIGRAWCHRRVAALGFASALNTVGNILGALIVGFVLLPKLGSLGTLHGLIVVCLFLSALSLPYVAKRTKPLLAAVLAGEVVLFIAQPAQFDLSSLSSGGNVYFQWQGYGRVIDAAESLDGGLTTVAVSGEDRDWSVLTLLTNGKFQGDDSTGGEMKAQSSFAFAPLLHTMKRDHALVIGFGTGTTTKVLHQAGFARIDVAELSGDILTLADRHFRAVNEGVLHKPGVNVHITDGRNYLLLDKAHYDVISIELSSIWFAGAANLYNREFYQLVRARLAPHGVFQQWIQLHRLYESDIATILSTLSEQFPNVWLYFLGKQGILVACVDKCEPTRDALAQLDDSEKLAKTLELFDGHVGQVLKGRLLTPSSLQRLVADAKRQFGSQSRSLIATDDNVTLEYTTPRGNVRPYDDSLNQNLRYLDKYKEYDVFAATALLPKDVPYLSP